MGSPLLQQPQVNDEGGSMSSHIFVEKGDEAC
jgi:hypothetical protein